MEEYSFVIFGEPASKANSRQFTRRVGIARMIKSKKALHYSETFRYQIPSVPVMLDGDLGIDITIYYASRRPDLDESLILDLLQGRIYTNDRQIKEKHIYHQLDRDNPRSEIRVYKLSVG